MLCFFYGCGFPNIYPQLAGENPAITARFTSATLYNSFLFQITVWALTNFIYLIPLYIYLHICMCVCVWILVYKMYLCLKERKKNFECVFGNVSWIDDESAEFSSKHHVIILDY